MSTLIQLFDKHTANAKSGQKLVAEIMEAAKVKTTEDADKVYAAYKARVTEKVTDKAEAESIIKIFNSRRHRWMTAQGIKAKAHTGGKAGTTKAGKATKVTKKAARAARAGTAKDQATPMPLHDVGTILTAIRLVLSGMSKADAKAVATRIQNEMTTILATK
jgi:predicted house-cleaning NTP pyrophosphatase (Maf/HAM1 superfamily)